MSVEEVPQAEVTVDVENIGGIDEATVEFSPGVTVLTGRNASNRTSLLKALMAALGSDDVSLKSDADKGSVELVLGEDVYRRTLERAGEGISTGGDPYLSDSTLADLFAFLLGSNEARQAVANSDDLRSIIMEPVDTADIQAEIDRLVERRTEIEEELDEIDQLTEKLPSLEEEQTRLEDEVEETRTELAELEDEIEAADPDVEDRRELQSAVKTKLSELQDKRSELDEVRYDLETEQESLENLRDERRELQEEYEDLPDEPADQLDEVESDLETLRSRKRDLETEINDVQSLIRFNEEMLEEVDPKMIAGDDEHGGSVTDQLVDDDSVECWTCGSSVERDQIQAAVDELRSLVQDKLGAVRDLNNEIDELKERGQELQDQQRRRDRIERRLRTVEADIEDSDAAIERLTDRREELTEEVAAIEDEINDLDTDDSPDQVLDLHKEANQLEYELGKLENERDRVEDNIASIEARLDEREERAGRREEIGEEIDALRTKIDRIERAAIDEFNDHMDTVLSRLSYENLERIWLERVEEEDREGRQMVTKTVFELHVVRTSSSGVTYEDTIDHLSESEREVTGLVFALAGYLAHEVHEEVPFILLDSVESIDSGRLSDLIDYFSDFAGHLVVALLPEDAAALDDKYERVTEI